MMKEDLVHSLLLSSILEKHSCFFFGLAVLFGQVVFSCVCICFPPEIVNILMSIFNILHKPFVRNLRVFSFQCQAQHKNCHSSSHLEVNRQLVISY